MAKIKLGKIAISWKGPYNSSTTYHAQDVVSYNNQCYICLTDNLTTSTLPTDNNHWDVFLESPISQVTTEHDLVRRNHEGRIERLPIGEEDTVLGIDYVTKTPTWQKMQFTKSTRVKKFTNDLGHDSLQLSCFVIDENDRLRGWGSNENYHLGIGTSDDDEMLPVHVAFPKDFCGVNKVYTSAKSYMGCIDNDGKWWVWGKDTAGIGSPGSNLEGQTLHVPVCISDDPLESINGKTIIESVHHYGTDNHYSNVLLASDGTVHFVGYNDANHLNGSDVTPQQRYVSVSPLSNVVSIAGTGEHRYSTYYALTSTGSLFAWGTNSNEQIDGSNTAKLITDITTAFSGKTIKKIICAPYRAFMIDVNDAIYSWGHNANGQLGRNSATNQPSLSPSTTPMTDGIINLDGTAPSKKVKLVFFNTNRNYAITGIVTQDNKVYTCGENSSNHSALNGTASSAITKLTEITSLSGHNIIKVACVGGEIAGSTTTMFLTADYRIFVGGYGGEGQLGNGKSNSVVIEEMKLFNSSLRIVDIHGYGYDNNSGFCLLNEDGRLFYCGSGAGMKSGDNDSLDKHIIQEILF